MFPLGSYDPPTVLEAGAGQYHKGKSSRDRISFRNHKQENILIIKEHILIM
jgi:hypothetical protein